jgi:FlaA1/EpsC-like NDP-sugar epimerase
MNNILVITFLTLATFSWTFYLFHLPFDIGIILLVITIRLIVSRLIFHDYAISWSKVSAKTFLIKSTVYISSFLLSLPFLYGTIAISVLVSELFLYLFLINFSMYSYFFLINRSQTKKTQSVIIYGAGKAGIQVNEEFKDSRYSVKYFIDDDPYLDKRSVDNTLIISNMNFKNKLVNNNYDILIIAMPSADQKRINQIYEELNGYFKKVKILPSIDEIFRHQEYTPQLKNISVEDLLARYPQDLDKDKISNFINNKTILVTGAGGSIGSEIVRQCIKFEASKIILLDHSEFNLYQIEQEVGSVNIIPVMQSLVNHNDIENTFKKYQPNIVIHAAAYKHVPLVEENISEAIHNNIMGTKNIIDIAIKYSVKKVVLISTDKAVRPTNVMGTTKRICELYAQNVESKSTDIVAVRFGNVLGSSGSVIPKFKSQIEKGENITVTHPEITRYFMLIHEACELVLQAGAIAKGGEIFILDMGEPIKIVDLAQKMIDLSGKNNIEIEFCGLRPGEKLYEELLIDDADITTIYESITVAKPTKYNIDRLNDDICNLIDAKDKIKILKEIVPEFDHKLN